MTTPTDKTQYKKTIQDIIKKIEEENKKNQDETNKKLTEINEQIKKNSIKNKKIKANLLNKILTKNKKKIILDNYNNFQSNNSKINKLNEILNHIDNDQNIDASYLTEIKNLQEEIKNKNIKNEDLIKNTSKIIEQQKQVYGQKQKKQQDLNYIDTQKKQYLPITEKIDLTKYNNPLIGVRFIYKEEFGNTRKYQEKFGTIISTEPYGFDLKPKEVFIKVDGIPFNDNPKDIKKLLFYSNKNNKYTNIENVENVNYTKKYNGSDSVLDLKIIGEITTLIKNKTQEKEEELNNVLNNYFKRNKLLGKRFKNINETTKKEEYATIVDYVDDKILYILDDDLKNGSEIDITKVKNIDDNTKDEKKINRLHIVEKNINDPDIDIIIKSKVKQIILNIIKRKEEEQKKKLADRAKNKEIDEFNKKMEIYNENRSKEKEAEKKNLPLNFDKFIQDNNYKPFKPSNPYIGKRVSIKLPIKYNIYQNGLNDTLFDKNHYFDGTVVSTDPYLDKTNNNNLKTITIFFDDYNEKDMIGVLPKNLPTMKFTIQELDDLKESIFKSKLGTPKHIRDFEDNIYNEKEDEEKKNKIYSYQNDLDILSKQELLNNIKRSIYENSFDKEDNLKKTKKAEEAKKISDAKAEEEKYHNSYRLRSKSEARKLINFLKFIIDKLANKKSLLQKFGNFIKASTPGYDEESESCKLNNESAGIEEEEIGKVSVKVTPYVVNQGKNSKGFRIADYRFDLKGVKPFSFIDKIENLLKNFFRFEQIEGSYHPVYIMNGNNRHYWFYKGINANLKKYSGEEGVIDPKKEDKASFAQIETKNKIEFKFDESNLEDFIGLDKDMKSIIKQIDEIGWYRKAITLEELAEKNFMLNEDIELDLHPIKDKLVSLNDIGSQTKGGTRKKRKQRKNPRYSSKNLTFEFSIVLKNRHKGKPIRNWKINKKTLRYGMTSFSDPTEKKRLQMTRRKGHK